MLYENARKKCLQQLVKKHGSYKKVVTVQVDSQQEVMDVESEIDKIAGL
jgi:hypothetical protein